MYKITPLTELFRIERKAGDLVFGIFFLILSSFLLSQIGNQIDWSKTAKFFSSPGFWPLVSLSGMTFFALMHLIGSALSPRIYGRRKESFFWFKSLEYAAWFLLYVWLVPIVGYLPMTIVFVTFLVFRCGYRGKKFLLSSLMAGFAIVLIFKTLLSVKIPGGMLYEYLPDAVRSFMLINF